MRECEHPLVMNNSKSLHYLRDVIRKWPFTDISLSAVKEEIGMYDMGKSETECEGIMRCLEKNLNDCLPALNLIQVLSTFQKGKDLDKV